LLMVRLIRAACWCFPVCQSLVLSYQVLCISDFPQHMELPMENSAPSNVENPYTRWEHYLVSLIEINIRVLSFCYIVIFIFVM
jgi:hypothetical protein